MHSIESKMENCDLHAHSRSQSPTRISFGALVIIHRLGIHSQ